jgi:diguanylate cyclase (GGDEF)-like protein
VALQWLVGPASPQFTLGYLIIGTALAFSAFGASLGVTADQLALANQRLTALASTDSLTGLRNPRLFHEILEVECARSRRDSQPLSLIALDLDKFKLVNDLHGHAAGDAVLAHVGSVLRQTVREGDVPCRTGGEEFAVICARTPLATAVEVAERIRRELESSKVPGNPALKVTASLGVSSRVGGAPPELYAASDRALYTSKQNGRNRVTSEPA